MPATAAAMKFCIYYSQRDWHHPDYSSANTRQVQPVHAKSNQRVADENTHQSTVFSLTPTSGTEIPASGSLRNYSKRFIAINPNIIINNRCGVPGDYGTPEQQIGGIDMEHTWESCMTFTGFWSWHGFDTPVIPVEKCLDYLISCAGNNEIC
jgi:alpha-L-fucosidase